MTSNCRYQLVISLCLAMGWDFSEQKMDNPQKMCCLFGSLSERITNYLEKDIEAPSFKMAEFQLR